jgi:hypothetical protein
MALMMIIVIVLMISYCWTSIIGMLSAVSHCCELCIDTMYTAAIHRLVAEHHTKV